jgi:6-phosphogluconolactonase
MNSRMEREAYSYDSPEAAAEALAPVLGDALREGIARRGAASLAISPRIELLPLFTALRGQALDWACIHIVLTDECWVGPGSEHSGEHLLRRHLVQGEVLDAQLVSLRTTQRKPIEAVVEVAEPVARLARPFETVVLTLGADGGIAGMIPGTPALDAMLKPDWAVKVAPVTAKVEPTERITLTLSALLDARSVFLVVPPGAADAYAEALTGVGPAAALLKQRRVPVCTLKIER